MNIVGHNPATASSPRGGNPFNRFNTTVAGGFGEGFSSPNTREAKGQGFLYQVD